MSGRNLVAVDWGTSSLRGALIDADGRVLEERSFARGILTVA
ncbi:MAG TPA: 2-dehydro-3-deoxygalactonokinase, partial [Polaromonas sp.]|nr:2-dehydro-3-deoxygalactonokinase [Polaromonas sp.]